MSLFARTRWPVVGVLIVVIAAAGAAAYFLWPRPQQAASLPEPGSPRYLDYLRAFRSGVAAMNSDKTGPQARAYLDRAIELVPEEPAAWADRGLLGIRDHNLAAAAKDLEQAQKLAPDSGAIEALLGLLAWQDRNAPETIAHLRKAVVKNPRDTESLFALAEAMTESSEPNADAEAEKYLKRILAIQPNNLHVLLRQAELALKMNDQELLHATLDRFDRIAPALARPAQQALAKVHATMKADPADLAPALHLFGNLLRSERRYARDAGAVQPDLKGVPLRHFLRLAQPPSSPSPPDRALAFTVGPWAGATDAVGKSRWDALRVVWRATELERSPLMRVASDGGLYTLEGRMLQSAVVLANGREVRHNGSATTLPFPGGAKALAPSPAGVLPLDWDNDYRMDLLLAGAGGLRFLHQAPDGSFTDVTAKTSLPAQLLEDDYYGAWAADIEMDGDLDVILARRSGPPLVLRDNADGTFTPLDMSVLGSVRDVRDFFWADLDNDGAPDPVFLGSDGKLHVFANERLTQFKPWPLPDDVAAARFVAITAADVNDDGVFDLVALRSDGAVLRISDKDHRSGWEISELARVKGLDVSPGAATLFVEDLDNNGAPDLVVAGPQEAHVFLADAKFQFEALPRAVPLRVLALQHLDDDGRLDMLGLSKDGEPRQALSAGRTRYDWQVLRPLANPTLNDPKKPPDQRNNAFAIGGELEVQAGFLARKQRITGPMLHFGLGEQIAVDVARIVWPNGAPQWEFDPPNDRVLLAAQRPLGSCPFLFTYDGTCMQFVGDCLWNTPLGMFVNGQNVDSFGQTTEWLKVRGEHLVPRDGYYDVRVHANLWETDYFDQLALLVVDHPPGTEIHIDERFFLTPTPPKMYVTTPARPVAQAWDHRGQDATDDVRAIDCRYLDRAGRGKFQGLAEDHWVEADLGDDAPAEGPVYLIARGWTHPTDSSINVAIAQGKHDAPRPLVLEVPDGKGGWKVGRPALGFPAGRNKTMVIRLDGIDGPGVARRFRLRTNMEIYWDFLGYARGLDEKLACIARPTPQSADLRYRGILTMSRKDDSSPDLPHYDQVQTGRQLWRDLTGHYTRFGDVQELLAKVDDRYVIMNAGDEIALRYPVPANPPAGWQRDFIFECDGWTRDGNPNTRFGTTVLPLPMHGIKGLDRPPGRLEDDPVYRRFPQDWLTYHTRYIGTEHFERGLRTLRRP
jgi:tetratricopeptide (TPR) repeat protein